MASRSSSPEASPAKQKSNLAAVRLDTELSAQHPALPARRRGAAAAGACAQFARSALLPLLPLVPPSLAWLTGPDASLSLADAVGLRLPPPALRHQARTDRPIEFIADYFSSVITGTHVVLRNFDYINACEHNRWAFVTSCIGAFAELPHDDLMDALELTQMIRLLCPDFPVQLVEHVFLLCGGEADAHPFRKVLEATLMWFYYNEFFVRAPLYAPPMRSLCAPIRPLPPQPSDRPDNVSASAARTRHHPVDPTGYGLCPSPAVGRPSSPHRFCSFTPLPRI
eukprot:scaffold17115_cov109-Isochrysis_galbana.AAC.1